MAFTTNKSAIAEVRDQLSLDCADDEHLNTIGQNLGINKYLFSFDDSIWRALIKTLAIEYKQIANKFRDVLDILFGPSVVVPGSMLQVRDSNPSNANVPVPAVLAGEFTFRMNDTSDLPQVGILIFDEGMATEETLAYKFIDRRYNEVVLFTPFSFDHYGRDNDAEEAILSISDTGEVVCGRTDVFPHARPLTDPLTGLPDPFPNPTPFPYTVILDRGKPTEAIHTVTANDTFKHTLTLSGTVDVHDKLQPTSVAGELLQPYFPEATLVVLESSKQFPLTGVVRLTPSNSFSTNAPSGGLTSVDINIAAGSFEVGDLCGYEIVFEGNVTAGLTGVRRRVIDNTTMEITLDQDFTDAGAFPVSGDSFLLFPVIKYTQNNYDQGTLNLYEPIPSSITIIVNSRVELLDSSHTVSLATVRSVGAGWDVIQSDPKVVELLIPEEIRGVNDLRSASYIHDDTIDPDHSEPLFLPANAGTTGLSFASTEVFPDTGVVTIDPLGVAERISYGRPMSYLLEDAPIGTTDLYLKDVSSFAGSGTVKVNEGSPFEETLTFSGAIVEGDFLSLSSPTTLLHRAGSVAKNMGFLVTVRELVNSYSASIDVDYYDPVYAGTSLPVGDYQTVDSTFPGPYVYSYIDQAPTGAANTNGTLSTVVPGSSLLAIDLLPGNTCAEVDSALAIQIAHEAGVASFPYELAIGRDRVQVEGVSLASRALNTVSTFAGTGSTTLLLTDPVGALLDGSALPTGTGYRLLINEALPNREVVYVLANPDPTTLLLESPLFANHIPGSTVRLMADALTISTPILSHKGMVSIDDRSTWVAQATGTPNPKRAFLPSVDPGRASAVRPRLPCVELTAVTGLDTAGGKVLLNFGPGTLPTVSKLTTIGANSLDVVDASDFPAVFPYEIVVGPGSRYEETLLVVGKTSNTLDFGAWTVRYVHPAGTDVVFRPGMPETLEYFDIDTNKLCFNPTAMLKYSHYPLETVIDSSTNSDPNEDGFDFPLRMPVDLTARLEYLLDLIRAAGVQVEIISKR